MSNWHQSLLFPLSIQFDGRIPNYLYRCQRHLLHQFIFANNRVTTLPTCPIPKGGARESGTRVHPWCHNTLKIFFGGAYVLKTAILRRILFLSGVLCIRLGWSGSSPGHSSNPSPTFPPSTLPHHPLARMAPIALSLFAISFIFRSVVARPLAKTGIAHSFIL